MLNQDCRSFRERLVEALNGSPRPDDLRSLSWHEHLLGCEVCRVVLEREEALEVLLATLPEPKLPPDLVRRVVVRLAEQQDAPLDSLLDLAEAQAPAGLAGRIREGLAAERALDQLLSAVPQPQVPVGLASRVATGARARADADLDALLDLDNNVAVPAGLSSRVLARLEGEREQHIPRLRLMTRMPRYAAAAAVLLGLLSAPWWADSATETQPDETPVVISTDAPETPTVNSGTEDVDPSLLAALDVLENDRLWAETASGSKALMEESDLQLFLEESVEVGDEILLAFLPREGGSNTPPSDG